MTFPTFDERRAAWSSPPVDDVGYISSRELLRLPSEELRATVRKAELARYSGWRNYENRWRSVLRLDDTHDQVVLDYGCGIGIEALQYARSGNDIVLMDISRDNVRLALRVLALEGFTASAYQITGPTPRLFGIFDVIHCAGVLHHIPEPEPVVSEMAAHLVPGGELRLMVYSDKAWRIACDSDPPEVVQADLDFERYWMHWDAVGGYADWYDVPRLGKRFGEWFDIIEARPLTQHGEYLGAVLRKR